MCSNFRYNCDVIANMGVGKGYWFEEQFPRVFELWACLFSCDGMANVNGCYVREGGSGKGYCFGGENLRVFELGLYLFGCDVMAIVEGC